MRKKQKQLNKQNYIINREKILEKNKCWRVKNKDKVRAAARAYYEANRNKIRTRSKAYYEKNKPKIQVVKHQWYELNSDQIRIKYSNWCKANRDIKNKLHAKRRAKKLKATPKWLTAADWAHIRAMYKQAAELTKWTGIPHHVDHIVPLQGSLVSGLHCPLNLQILTAEENSKKSNKIEA